MSLTWFGSSGKLSPKNQQTRHPGGRTLSAFWPGSGHQVPLPLRHFTSKSTQERPGGRLGTVSGSSSQSPHKCCKLCSEELIRGAMIWRRHLGNEASMMHVNQPCVGSQGCLSRTVPMSQSPLLSPTRGHQAGRGLSAVSPALGEEEALHRAIHIPSHESQLAELVPGTLPGEGSKAKASLCLWWRLHWWPQSGFMLRSWVEVKYVARIRDEYIARTRAVYGHSACGSVCDQNKN